jgi:Uma2 family endonuclease
MATAPTLPHVPVDEYLNSTYEHDMEYVDGVLVERSLPTISDSLLQAILIGHFRQLEKEYGYKALPELRTQIIERARYRIPDVMLCPKPLPEGDICIVVPWAVIEILSPRDTVAATRDRFRDYANIGVQHLVLMDPEEFIAYRVENGSLIENKFHSLSLPDGRTVPFDSGSLFAQLESERTEE